MSSEEEASAGSVVCAMPQGRLVSIKPPSRIANTGGSRRWDPQFGWLKVNSSPAASRLATRKKYPLSPVAVAQHLCDSTSLRIAEHARRRVGTPPTGKVPHVRMARLPRESSPCAWRPPPPEMSRPSPAPTR
jgi:hypothetical protein